jgi:type I restriction enzyme S subunit
MIADRGLRIADWKTFSFEEAVADVSAGNEKTPQSEFLSSGRFPVVDQGKELIAGYVDDQSRLCRAPLPAIVFGDHTRCFKFVDFPFCMGADGVKVLVPRVEADVKFLYHYLRRLRITNGGYDRHFKYLKRFDVVMPPLPEQRRIAEVLDRAEALRAERRAALAQLDSLIQSLFLDLFGDPGLNSRKWPMAVMRDLFSSSPIFGTMIPPVKGGGQWVSIRVANIQNWELDLSDEKTVELPPTAVERHSVVDGDLLMARAIASEEHLGKAIIVYPSGRKWAFDSHVMRLRFQRAKAIPEFIRSLLMTAGGRRLFLKCTRRSAVQFNINTKEIAGLEIPLPPLPLQQTFARRVAAVERLKAGHRAALAHLDALFASLQHRAFRGEL